jgi:hypothetical protein
MRAIALSRNSIRTFAASAGAALLVALFAGSAPALADSKKEARHEHRVFRHRLVPIGYADAYSGCRYERTVEGLIEICPQPSSVISAHHYIGKDPDARIRSQMLIDFDRGASFPGGHGSNQTDPNRTRAA